MNRVLLVVGLVLALAGAILWFANSSSSERGSRPSEPAPSTENGQVSTTAPLLSAPPDAAAPPADEPAAGAQSSAPPAARREAGKLAELANAQWIEGRVLFPAGTPEDEQVFVTADGAGDDESDHRVEVARDGSFRVAFGEKTRSGRFELEARYLYLGEIVRWKSKESTGQVVLQPKLGTRIAGRVRLPAGTNASNVGGKLELEISHRSGNSFDNEQRGMEELSQELTFAFDALVPGVEGERSYELSYDGDALVGRAGSLVPEAGKTLALELELRPGVVLAGVVRDEGGAPLSDVEVSANVQSSSGAWTSAHHREATSAADGSFRLGALAGGKVELQAQLEGFEPMERELGRLGEGKSIQDLALVLERGSSISGTVRWPDGSPAEAALVLVPQQTGLSWSSGQEEVNGKSDASGAFSISGLSRTAYRVTACATKTEEVLVKSEITGKERPKKQRTQWSAEAEQVEVGTSALVLTLSTGLALEGRVLDDVGTPLADFFIVAERVESGRDYNANPDISRSFRDTDGSFRMDGFAAGVWKVSSWNKDHAASDPVRVTLPGAGPVVLLVPREAVVSGRVLDPSGAPLPAASVQADEERERSEFYLEVDEKAADENGFFEIDGLGPGRVVLQAHGSSFAPSAPQTVELAAGEMLAGLVLRLRPGGTILGELIGSDGRPRAGRVWLNGEGFRAYPETDTEGRFQVNGVPAGEIRLGAQTEEGIQIQQRVTLSEGETMRVRLAPPGGLVRLHGHVRAGGEPLVNARVNASRSEEGGKPSGTASAYSQTGEDGAYELQLPGPGRYRISIHGRDERLLSWSDTLDAPAVAALEFDVSIPVGRISGRVTDAHGRALANMLVASEPERHEGGAHGSAQALTDAEGRYELLVPAGQHAVKASGGQMPWRLDAEAQPYAETRVSGLTVSVNGHLRGVDLRLDTGGVLEGLVRMADGSSAARVSVWAQGSSWQQNARSDDGGHFQMRLAAGSYLVQASSGEESACEPVRVEIASGETRRVELELVPAQRVLLTILQNGTPVGCELQVFDARGQRQRVQTRENGRVWLGPLIPGRYTARAQRDGKEVERAFEVAAGEEPLELELVFE